MPVIDDWTKSFYRITGHPERPDELRFDVYEYYLENWVDFINQKYKNFDNYIKFVIDKTRTVQGRKNIDTSYLKRFLFIGWNTEYLLSYNDKGANTDILRINNQWKPIQAYYSVYSLAESAIYCLDSKTENHSICLKKISEYLVNKNGLKSLEPWTFAFTGYHGNKNVPRTINPINFPPRLTIPNALKRIKISPIESIACCLQAEHCNKIDEWKKPKGGVYKYKYNPGLTTIFHFLYRLRIKSNYKDAELFMVEAPDEKIKTFSNNLTFLVASTNALLEILIIRKLGKKKFLELTETFLKKNKGAQIGKRLDYYKANL